MRGPVVETPQSHYAIAAPVCIDALGDVASALVAWGIFEGCHRIACLARLTVATSPGAAPQACCTHGPGVRMRPVPMRMRRGLRVTGAREEEQVQGR